MKINSKRGFTLIELLVVIAIIGLLSSVVLASLNGARAKARDAQRISDIRQINTAVQLYISATGHAPYIANGLGGDPQTVCDINTGNTSCSTASVCESTMSDCVDGVWQAWNDLGVLLSPYLAKMPKDPTSISETFNYFYYGPSALKNQFDGGEPVGSVANSPTMNTDYVIGAKALESKAGTGFGVLGNGSVVTSFSSAI